MAAVAERRRAKERRKDPRRRIAVEIALGLAEMNAGWGDNLRALEHLAAADQLSGGALSPRLSSMRESLIREVPESR
jgi:hypothetical protein